MGTTSSTTSTSSSSSIFNGDSRYASDFQAVISRATAIASMPITQLENQKSALSGESTALTGLSDVFTKLQSAVDGINQSLSGSSFQSEVSDSSVLTVTLGDGAMEGNYSVEVLDAGAYATSMTASTWVAASGAAHSYKLSIGGKQYAVNASDNTAASVADAINSQYSDKVRATVVNVGSSASPDYRISLQAVTLGDLQPDLLDGTTSLQKQQTTGKQAEYVVNDSGQDVYSSSRSVTIANGITVNLEASAVGSPVNITVTRSSSAVSDALQSFAIAYNNAVDEVNKQHGQSAGALAGQSVVRELSQVLSQIATYSASDSQTGSLAGLGLELDQSGQMSFNSFQFMAADIASSAGITSFLGSSTTKGFLKWATDRLTSVDDSTSGLIKSAQDAITTESNNIDNSIADQQAIVDRMTAQMQSQMATADALIASMEQQYTYLTGMFKAMQTDEAQYQ